MGELKVAIMLTELTQPTALWKVMLLTSQSTLNRPDAMRSLLAWSLKDRSESQKQSAGVML